MIVTGSPMKGDLNTSPFLHELEYGKIFEGYWTYNHMVVQLEDCIDVLTIIYPDFDFVVFLNNSNGHNKMRPDGLNINKIGLQYRGKQPKI